MDGTIVGENWAGRTASRSVVPTMPPIPDHKPNGLLPPFLGTVPGESSDLMSPYPSTLAEFVAKFGTSAERRRILLGYLKHRAALRSVGITKGFQWLDGSFVEVMPREPRDIDLVTFYVAPPDWNEDDVVDRNKGLFRPRLAKKEYCCDPYFVCINSDLNDARAEAVVRLTSFWHGLFSHQRDSYTWRGIVSVQVATEDDDSDARSMIEIMEQFGNGGDA
jgi:hypothetical protein